ncbi:hypothetical protein M407DRAFT_21312 [Tulasnella calospora MUT 4182]|uniref:Protein CPL1-like domain-containing protein n=1 Tax=Tulasnella calospora MUT 4182 TaxID=1051891 RepID=A0A0C3L6T8_9AGAM|nr:hypothetical protein M407DRAFT_21312 [Tulasnella calospora MUT 4182]
MPSPRYLQVLALALVIVPSIFASAIPGARPPTLEDNKNADMAYLPCYIGEEMCMKAHSWDTEEPWECIDTQTSITSCGGCSRPSQDDQPLGRDCTIIPGQMIVSCVRGDCVVSKCQSGWKLTKDNQACYELYDEGD